MFSKALTDFFSTVPSVFTTVIGQCKYSKLRILGFWKFHSSERENLWENGVRLVKLLIKSYKTALSVVKENITPRSCAGQKLSPNGFSRFIPVALSLDLKKECT